jgi:hypothetical protein
MLSRCMRVLGASLTMNASSSPPVLKKSIVSSLSVCLPGFIPVQDLFQMVFLRRQKRRELFWLDGAS